MSEKTMEFFVYSHDERKYEYVQDERKDVLSRIVKLPTVPEIEDALKREKIDGLLVLDENGQRWFLVFGSHMGIVGQRTARRQADSITRSGFRIPGKYTIRVEFPLEELSDPNIGDLWKTAQQKYIKSTLSGMEVDEETGIPSQIAERARLLNEAGYEDELTMAELEKQEAELRERVKQKEQTGKTVEKPTPITAPDLSSKKSKDASNITKTTKKKKTPVKQDETKKEEPKVQKTTKDKQEVDLSKLDFTKPFFYQIIKLKEYVEDNYTVFSTKGKLQDLDNEFEALIVFKQQKIKPKTWNDIVVFMKEGDLLQLVLEYADGVLYALEVEK